MTEPEEHLNEANTRFDWANRAFDEEEYGLAGHLFINSAIKYADFLCQKYLEQVYSREHHSDTEFLHHLEKHIKTDYPTFKNAYKFLMDHKSHADYGAGMSETVAKQIKRRAGQIKEIAERY